MSVVVLSETKSEKKNINKVGLNRIRGCVVWLSVDREKSYLKLIVLHLHKISKFSFKFSRRIFGIVNEDPLEDSDLISAMVHLSDTGGSVTNIPKPSSTIVELGGLNSNPLCQLPKVFCVHPAKSWLVGKLFRRNRALSLHSSRKDQNKNSEKDKKNWKACHPPLPREKVSDIRLKIVKTHKRRKRSNFEVSKNRSFWGVFHSIIFIF